MHDDFKNYKIIDVINVSIHFLQRLKLLSFK